MTKQKIAIVTGATGGIGGSFAFELTKLGFVIFAPVRDEQKAEKLLGENPLVAFEKCDLENEESVFSYIEKIKKEGIFPNLIVLSAGQFSWDNNFVGKSFQEKQKNAKEELKKINFDSKRYLIEALDKFFPNDRKKISLILVSSQAADFAENDPKRINQKTDHKQEGYIFSMKLISDLGDDLNSRESTFGFKKVVVLKPELLDTPGVRNEFNLSTIGEDIDWSKVKKPGEYIHDLFKTKLKEIVLNESSEILI